MDYLSGWCKSQRRLDGTTAIVTGSNSGIGKETAKDLYYRGARVIMACRDKARAEKAKKEIESAKVQNEPTGCLVVEELDLNSLQSVREFTRRMVANEQDLKILINNAGVMCAPKGITEDGFETHMGTNHFGPALLTLLLLPRLQKNTPSRIINVSSMLHAGGDIDFNDINYKKSEYNPLQAYSRSKCANVLFTLGLTRMLKEHGIVGVNTYSLHPGVINTEISRHFSDSILYGATWAFKYVLGWFLKSVRCGAQTTIYCAVDEACAGETGLYYEDCASRDPSIFCQNEEVVSKFWDITIASLNLGDYNPFTNSDPEEKHFVKNTTT